VARLAELPACQRGPVPGIKPGRGDIILAAPLVLDTVVHRGSFAGLEVTSVSVGNPHCVVFDQPVTRARWTPNATRARRPARW